MKPETFAIIPSTCCYFTYHFARYYFVEIYRGAASPAHINPSAGSTFGVWCKPIRISNEILSKEIWTFCPESKLNLDCFWNSKKLDSDLHSRSDLAWSRIKTLTKVAKKDWGLSRWQHGGATYYSFLAIKKTECFKQLPAGQRHAVEGKGQNAPIPPVF